MVIVLITISCACLLSIWEAQSNFLEMLDVLSLMLVAAFYMKMNHLLPFENYCLTWLECIFILHQLVEMPHSNNLTQIHQ